MSTQLPPPAEIAKHYNETMREIGGDYIHKRWGDSETKRRHYRQTELALQAALSRIPLVGDVLEIGCGPAVWTPLFLPHAKSVSLFDISEEMLGKARQRIEAIDGGKHAAKVSYTCGDFVETPFEGEFDTVISARAFEYMSDKSLFVRKCVGLLRPGGSFVLVTKNKAWRDLQQSARRYRGVPREKIPVGDAMHLNTLSWGEVSGMFREAGLQEVEAYPVVFGSYERPLTLPGGLALSDALHRWKYRKPISRTFDSLIESYLIIGRKPR